MIGTIKSDIIAIMADYSPVDVEEIENEYNLPDIYIVNNINYNSEMLTRQLEIIVDFTLAEIE